MPSVQSIERAFAVLRRLASGPAGVTELADRVDLPKSTVSRLLSTLESIGAVEQISVGGPYRIGPSMMEIVAAVAPAPRLIDLVRPHLLELVEATGEAAGLSVLAGSEVHYLDQVDSPNAVQVRDWTGERLAPHGVSSGLVLMAFGPPERVDDVLSRPLAHFTPRTMVDPAAIRARLEQIRADGYAWIHEEFEVGANSVAAPIRLATGVVVAAIHAHGPAYRFPVAGAEAQVGALVATVAARASRQLASA